MRLPILLAVLALAGCAQADLDGRAGNRALESGRPGDALQRYDDGLIVGDTADRTLRFRLQNNAALAELARDSARAALSRADEAAGMAPDPGTEASARYHGGIAAAAAGASDDALARFRRASLLDEAAEDAAFNWEVVARQQRPGGGDGDGDGEASPPENGDGDAPPQPGESPPPPTPQRPDPSQAPPRLSPEEASRLLDALAREEAGLVRRTVRGNPSSARPTKDW